MMEYENLQKLNKSFFSEYKKSFAEILEVGQFVLGANVEEFEKNFADYINTQYSVGVGSGLDALTLSLRSFDFPINKEVIVPSNTFIATILSILHANLKPVLVEPDINTYNIDPDKLEEKITSNTVAIMAVHLYGKCCQVDKISAICKKHNLRFIEDCAQAHGAKFKDQKTGSIGDIGAFSFYPTKNLGALGDGGAITSNDVFLIEKIRILRNYGSKVKYENEIPGFNSRLDELQAAFLNIKLKKLDEINTHKRKLAQIYLEELREDFIKPVTHPDYYDVYHIFNIRHPQRDKLRDYLLKHDIKTEIHYPIPPNKQTALARIFKGEEYAISDEIHNTTLSLPISYFHTPQDIERAVEVLNRF